MTPHELMVKTNPHLIKGGELTEEQKAKKESVPGT